jgi:hypothetical protein
MESEFEPAGGQEPVIVRESEPLLTVLVGNGL